MNLLFDKDDEQRALKGDARFQWLRQIGATLLEDADADEPGFLFGYDQGESALERQLRGHPHVHDRPDERAELTGLDNILSAMVIGAADIPTPRSWVLRIDDPEPDDLVFPLFVRTARSSWKRGGEAAKVSSRRQLADEIALLRRSFQWDATIVARVWLDLAPAGEWPFGEVPQEVRVWIVNREPVAWSFHYLAAVRNPRGFPPLPQELRLLHVYSQAIGKLFRSRLIAADYAKDRTGKWHFLEAGPGGCSGTAHEAVFKAVARTLRGEVVAWHGDECGGPLPIG
jgi:hypothetical protein